METFDKRMDLICKLADGRLVYPRFTQEEIKASYGSKHETLWEYILRLESTKFFPGGSNGCTLGTLGETQQNCEGKWDFSELGTLVRWNPGQGVGGCGGLELKEIKFLDRGVESVVYVTARNTVRKFRQIHPYNANAIIDELAKLVYHNYLFPKDLYVLNDILRYEEDGYKYFFLDIEQPFVIPLVDEHSFIIAPSYAQIHQSLQLTPMKFRFHSTPVSGEESGTTDSELVPAAKTIAYNDQFILYDFQPGRNTFIDAVTGEIRFIDPRIDINEPGSPNPASKFGTRKKYDGMLNVDQKMFDDFIMRSEKMKNFLSIFK